jgi:hypothetical protein
MKRLWRLIREAHGTSGLVIKAISQATIVIRKMNNEVEVTASNRR